jgi:hypothetical protein
MPHVLVHAVTALPALYFGEPLYALGCVVPDVAWLPIERRLRKSGMAPEAFIEQCVTERALAPYRLTHSLLPWAAVALAHKGAVVLAVGAVLHVALDLFTHHGKTAQQPFWPLSRWRWPWPLPPSVCRFFYMERK